MKKISEMPDSEIVRACHFYVEENGLVNEWEAFRKIHEIHEKDSEPVLIEE
ncbi:MAG: hypothetical protein IJM51_02360 [Clostridia bacterium]|nr:hypothetical protein [Clostridia bacterium]